ncbi:phytochrome kinase substrate 2 [Artemisia annua]|uniref:Phytochrome kinase substrate 2 n=1 Tax=Artemisia annua TaxID=35608 RepID=A0A2U1NX71_ARTAN|nr:phytochrome kinase substrate 2 [Artemisia annua]
MIASEKRVSLFGNNVDHQDVSFSSYLNENNTMVLKLTHPPQINLKKKVEDGEIGIFGAEKYFKGAMDDQLPRTPHSIKPTNYHPNNLQGKNEEPPKPQTGSATPSVRSEASWNSRSGLLANGGYNQQTRQSAKREKTSSVKSLFTSLGCNCNDKASIKIAENKVIVKEPVKPPTKVYTGGFNDNKVSIKREDCFAFPVLNSNTHHTVKTEIPKVEEEDITHVRTRRNSLEAFGSPILEKGKKSFSLEKKLTMLNWDGVTPRSENIDMRGEHNDAGTSAAGFSIMSDYEDTRTSKTLNMPTTKNVKANGDMDRAVKGTTGILSGCNSHKSVRVAGEHVMVSNGVLSAEKLRAVGITSRGIYEHGNSVFVVQNLNINTAQIVKAGNFPFGLLGHRAIYLIELMFIHSIIFLKNPNFLFFPLTISSNDPDFVFSSSQFYKSILDTLLALIISLNVSYSNRVFGIGIIFSEHQKARKQHDLKDLHLHYSCNRTGMKIFLKTCHVNQELIKHHTYYRLPNTNIPAIFIVTGCPEQVLSGSVDINVNARRQHARIQGLYLFICYSTKCVFSCTLI